jgi:hypothetical protein
MEGALTANGQTLRRHDAAQIEAGASAPARLELEAGAPEGAHFMIIEMAKA